MFFERRAKRLIEPSWNHGVYLDNWSFVHLISGVLLGLVALFIGMSYDTGAIVAVLIFTLYEGVEIAARIVEDVQNSVTDIVIGIVGFSLVYLLIPDLEALSIARLIVVFLLLDAFLLWVGWNKYLHRKLKDRIKSKLRKLR